MLVTPYRCNIFRAVDSAGELYTTRDGTLDTSVVYSDGVGRVMYTELRSAAPAGEKIEISGGLTGGRMRRGNGGSRRKYAFRERFLFDSVCV